METHVADVLELVEDWNLEKGFLNLVGEESLGFVELEVVGEIEGCGDVVGAGHCVDG